MLNNLLNEIHALEHHADRAKDDPSELNLSRLREQMTNVDNLIIKHLATKGNYISVECSDMVPEGYYVMISPGAVLSVDNEDLIKDLIDRKLLVIGRI